MNTWQTAFLSLFVVVNLGLLFKSFDETKNKKNAFGLTRGLFFIGAFVWADAVVFSIFWASISLTCLFLKDWTLFLLLTSLFWLVRAIGETMYWFNQQFSTLNRNPVETLPLRWLFHNDSIWFVHQIFWQCVTVVLIVLTMHVAAIWLK